MHKLSSLFQRDPSGRQAGRHRWARYLIAALFGSLIAGCASSGGGTGKDETGVFMQAATAPLNDLNIVRTEIPPVLLAAQKVPYGLPEELSCTALAARIRELDAVLGPDIAARASRAEAEFDLVEEGADAVSDAAVGAVRGAAQSVMPFRNWIRRLSGAERHSKEVSAAISAGNLRRAFLKGVGAGMGCIDASVPLLTESKIGPPVPENDGDPAKDLWIWEP